MSAAIAQLLPPDVVARISELSFKEGQGSLSHIEQNELETILSVDEQLSNSASSHLAKLMYEVYKLGELVARGEA